MKFFPSENQNILEPSIADYILLGFIFSVTSGLTAFIIGKEDISVFLSVFMAQAFSYWGLIGLIEFKEGKVKRRKKDTLKKFQNNFSSHLKYKVNTEKIFRELDNEE